MQVVSFGAVTREGNGKKGAKAVRNAGLIPSVLYGGDENIHFSVKRNDVKSLIYTGEFKLAKIDLDGNSYDCIIKSVQFHPVTDEILHIDFLRLVDGTPIKVELPVRFKGVSPGVKEGGKLIQSVRRVKVKTTPENLVDQLLCDISGVHLGQAVRVRDLELGEGIQVMNPGGIPIASVEVPRALKGVDEDEAGVVTAEGDETTEEEVAPTEEG